MSPIRREVQIGDCRLILGDCLEVLPLIGRFALPHEPPQAGMVGPHQSWAVISDPPYGMDWNTDSRRFSGGARGHRKPNEGRGDWGSVVADDQPFDPLPWLEFNECILWGSNHFGARLPVGSTLVWLKRLDHAFGSFLSDAEIAWKKGGHGIYCRRDLSMNAEASHRVHPTQKPIGIMSWCIEQTRAATILDPFMGSGTTLVACAKLGRRGIGIEIDEGYFDIAVSRVEKAYAQPDLFIQQQGKRAEPLQESLI